MLPGNASNVISDVRINFRELKALACHVGTVKSLYPPHVYRHASVFAQAFFKDYFPRPTTSKPSRQAERSPDALEKNANETVERRTGPLRFLWLYH